MKIKKSARIYFKCGIFYVFSPFKYKILNYYEKKTTTEAVPILWHICE